MPEPKYETWCLTIRPGDGIPDAMIPLVVEWVKKRAKWYYIITEKEGHEKHFHIAMVTNRLCSRSNINTNLISSAFAKDWTPAQVKVLRSGTRIWYSNDWATNYLQKDDKTVVVSEHMPPPDKWSEEIEAKYPLPDDDQAKRKFEGDPQMLKLEKLWYVYSEKDDRFARVTKGSVTAFLHQIMYVDRLICVIQDPRRQAFLITSLMHFVQAQEIRFSDIVQIDGGGMFLERGDPGYVS